ncbi:ATP-binding cassette domain-containing protein [Paenibacillus sp. FSL W7-1332]|uniref:ATP-binding cassette domain-containing protein n=1 Tax=Paenibacillus sp. FSL W7-1332 TaxID=2921702 RepID=UPI0030D383DC
MLEIQRLYKEIHGRPILEDIHFEIEDGGSLAIVGESGSGKSTLAQLIMALKQPTSGHIFFDGGPCPTKEYYHIENGIAIYRLFFRILAPH